MAVINAYVLATDYLTISTITMFGIMGCKPWNCLATPPPSAANVNNREVIAELLLPLKNLVQCGPWSSKVPTTELHPISH